LVAPRPALPTPFNYSHATPRGCSQFSAALLTSRTLACDNMHARASPSATRRGQSEGPCRYRGAPEFWEGPNAEAHEGRAEWHSGSGRWGGSTSANGRWDEGRDDGWWEGSRSHDNVGGKNVSDEKSKSWDEPEVGSRGEGGRRAGEETISHNEGELGKFGHGDRQAAHNLTQTRNPWKRFSNLSADIASDCPPGHMFSSNDGMTASATGVRAHDNSGKQGPGVTRDDEHQSGSDGLPFFPTPIGGSRVPLVRQGKQNQRSSTNEDRAEAAERLKKFEALRQKRAEEARRESEEQRKKVNNILLPVVSDGYVQLAASAHHPGTCSWLFEEVDRWWRASDSRLFVLEGSSGFGKTTFLGALCASRPEMVKAFHFGRHDCSLRQDARWVVRSLASQLACNWPKISLHIEQSGITREELEEMTAQSMFRELIQEPLELATGDLPAKLAFVIDGLDEGEVSKVPAVHRIQRLIELCFHELPSQVVFIVGMKPGSRWGSQSLKLKPHVVLIDGDSRHDEDVEVCVRDVVLPGLVSPGPEMDAAATALRRRVRGHFLHARLARAILARWTSERQRLTAAMVEGLLPDTPSGTIGAYLGPHLREPEPGNVVAAGTRSLLLAAAVAPTPLPAARGAADLVEGCPMAAVPAAVGMLAQLFPVVDGRLAAVHQAVTDWFRTEQCPVDLKAALLEAHAGLARRCLLLLEAVCEAQRVCAPVPEGGPKHAAREYAVNNGLLHVWAARDCIPEDLQLQAHELLFDARYIRAKCHFLPQEYEAQEQEEAAHRLPSLARPLRLVRSALFVSMEAVRQLPKVHVAEQVWDRAQKAIATRCDGTRAYELPLNRELSRMLEHVRGRCRRNEDLRYLLMLEPVLEAFSAGTVAMLTGHTQWVMALCTYRSASGELHLASGGGDHTLRVWADLERGLPPLRTLEGHSDHVRALAPYCLSDGSRRLASGCSDNTLRIWSPEGDGEAIAVLDGHTDWVRGLATFTAADGKPHLASGSSDCTVKIWTLDEDKFSEVRTLEGHERMVMKLASYSSRRGAARIVSGAADRTIRVWDPELAGPALRVMDAHKHWVTALETFTDDAGEARLASGCADATIFIWDPEAGGPPLGQCEGHSEWVCEITSFVGAHGRRQLASSSADRTLRVWDPEKGGEPLAVLEGHGHWIRGLVSFPGSDGSPRLASGSDDRTIRIWHV